MPGACPVHARCMLGARTPAARAPVQARLVAAESESAGWAMRQQLVLAELDAERAAAQLATAELTEARAQLSSAK